ncbi:hypothetical protein [Spirosoma oryzicola]|uniref:hypothetical protein n=1 Tax=Spirosoma oryzicola TaxID=2898794 RepID=UPI001E5889AC|nr:hypothetical protein [Spirosoma oryzicola]UHG90108.1 hypothetical protein LQ777_17870 [Spirosoma oryzicola]
MQTKTATNIFWQYFRSVSENTENVLSVSQSNGERMERLLAASVNEPIYPAVFAMRPKYKPFDNGADQYSIFFEAVFYVFCQSEQGNQESEDMAFDQAEAISLAILQQFKLDHQTTEGVDFDYNTAHLEPVTMMTLDSTAGYEVKLKIGLVANDLFRNDNR